MEDWRLVIALAWGGGIAAFASRILWRRRRRWRKFRDARARGELLQGVSLWLTSAASAIAVWLLLFPPGIPGLRGVLVTIAIGAFLVHLIQLDHDEREQPDGLR